MSFSEKPASTHEQQRQDVTAVSVDKTGGVYLLEDSGWVVYHYSAKGHLRRVALSKSQSLSASFPNHSLTVNDNGSVWWCSTTGKIPVEGREGKWATILRAYSPNGKLLQEWNYTGEFADLVGYVQAVDRNDAVIVGGGPNLVFTIGQASPQVKKFIADYISHDETIWNLERQRKGDYTGTNAYLVRATSLTDNEKNTISEGAGVFISGDFEPRTVFWHSPDSGLYVRKMIRESEGQTQFGFGIYRIDSQGLHHIVDLKRENDSLLQGLGTNIYIGNVLSGEGDEAVFYATEKLSRNSKKTPKHYVFRVSLVSRWKTWFS